MGVTNSVKHQPQPILFQSEKIIKPANEESRQTTKMFYIKQSEQPLTQSISASQEYPLIKKLKYTKQIFKITKINKENKHHNSHDHHHSK